MVDVITDKDLLMLFSDMVSAQSAYIDSRLASLNLSSGQSGIITVLGRNGNMTQNQLAKHRKVSPATISIMLDRMERGNLVKRKTIAENSRAKSVSLTDKGKELYFKLDDLLSGEPAAVLKGLSKQEKEFASVIFKKITDNIID